MLVAGDTPTREVDRVHPRSPLIDRKQGRTITITTSGCSTANGRL
jgi:hypothetical protein